MNSVGILSAGGLGRVQAHWIIEGSPDVDVTGFHVDRFRPWQGEDAYRAARTTEILGTVYAAHTPGTQLRSARNRLLSPVHDRLVEQGGYLREVSGWEGADWFAGPGAEPAAEPTWGRAPWFEHWEAEHRAVREGVGLMDMSFMAKFRVQGADAGRVLDQMSAGAVNEEPETITYTQWLDEDGRIEGDLTVTKLAEDDPSRTLVSASEDADTVVVGSRGRGDAASVVFGSVSRFVVEHAHCPVIVVRRHT
jgi:4-methylaminobutanoate oxidase (formaldehyde-forming)